jgi:hypothetical protein
VEDPAEGGVGRDQNRRPRAALAFSFVCRGVYILFFDRSRLVGCVLALIVCASGGSTSN